MIVKYLKDGVWGYIDNVRQVASKDIDTAELIKEYKGKSFDQLEDDTARYMNGQELEPYISASNMVFVAEIERFNDIFEEAQYGTCHKENLIDGKTALDNYPAATVLMYLNDHKEYDTIIFITNQKCYLMNDKGQTIERLV